MKNLTLVQKLIGYCAKALDNPSPEDLRKIKAFILVWISTTIIMWFYVAFSYWVYDFTIVGTLGTIYTIIHTLSPVIYRYSKSLTLAGVNISLTALFFQITFCIYNGGIHSPSAIWFTAHPVIISFFASKRLIAFSVTLNMLVVIALTLLGNYGYFPTDALSSSFTQYMMITSLIFLDIIIATYTVVFIMTTEEHSKELEERNDLIENLMRIISHDISNALNISTNSSKSLGKLINTDDEKAMRKLELINKSNKQITEISHSVLHWMKSQHADFKLKCEKLSIEELVNFLRDSFTPTFSAKKINFTIENSVSDNNKSIFVDISAFKHQVVTNVVTNAIKFTPFEGTINIALKEKADSLILSITDDGIGIPQDILKNIFDPSKSSSRKGTGGESGTGFGMPIVKNLIEGMKGTISIESYEVRQHLQKRGTTITITVPLCIED